MAVALGCVSTMKNRRHNSGFTLIEAMIAIVIMAIAMPPILWALRDAHVQRVDPISSSRARWLACEKLEDILADRDSTSRGYAYLTNANYAAEAPVSGFTGFSRSVQVAVSGANLVAGSGTGFKTVAVTVTYTNGKGASQPVTVSSVVTDY